MSRAKPTQPPTAAQRPNIAVRALTAITGPWTWRNVLGWLILICFVLLLRWAVLDQFKIPSGSMEPTLHGDPGWGKGDRVSVNKFVYGLRFPLNDFHIPFTDITIHYAERRLWRGADPKRWDIVVFNSVEDDDPGKVLIKRVVGLPGERIHIAHAYGRIQVNGKTVMPPEDLHDILFYFAEPDKQSIHDFVLLLASAPGPPPWLNPDNAGARKLSETLHEFHKTLAGRVANPAAPEAMALLRQETAPLFKNIDHLAYNVARERLTWIHEQEGTFQYGVRKEDEYAVVPPDCYLLLGDNSRNSRDGRCFGWVPNEHIMGRATCIGWPLSRWRDFTGFSKTWWGRGLLFGIPGLVIALEMLSFLHKRRNRQSETDANQANKSTESE